MTFPTSQNFFEAKQPQSLSDNCIKILKLFSIIEYQEKPENLPSIPSQVFALNYYYFKQKPLLIATLPKYIEEV